MDDSSIRTEFVQKIVLNEDGSSEKSNSYTVIIKTSSSNDEYSLNYCKDTIEEANEASKEMQKFITNEYPFITLYYDDNLYACNTSMYDGWVASKSGSTLNVFSFLPEEVQK